MPDDRRRRRPKPPQPDADSAEDYARTDEHEIGPIHDEMQKRGLSSGDPPEEAAPEDEALVFGGDGAMPDDAGPTYVGEIPDADGTGQADDRDKTEILATESDDGADYPILTVDTADGTSEIDVVTDSFIIGRSPDCDVVIADQLISRQHAVLEHRADGWYVVDQKSGNGTFLNDDRIQDARLYDGDVIYVGDAALTYTAPASEIEAQEPQGQARPPLDKTTLLPLGEEKPAKGRPDTRVTPKRRKGRKRFLVMAGLIVVVIGALGIVKQLTKKPPPPPEPSPQEQAAIRQKALQEEAKAAFERVKEFVKEEKWAEVADVIVEIAEVLHDVPEVLEYKETIEREVQAERSMAEAEAKLSENDFEAAMAAVIQVSAKSFTAEKAMELKTRIEEKRVAARLAEARRALDEKDFEAALKIADEILLAHTDHEAALEVKRLAEKGYKPSPTPTSTPGHKKKRKKKKKVTPPPPPRSRTLLIDVALTLYREGDVEGAYKQAETAGVQPEGIKKLQNFKQGYTHCRELARNTGQAPQAQKCLEGALRADRKLGGGRGKVTEDLKSKLGKVHFVQGVDAQTRQKFDKAYQHFKKTLRYRPSFKQAQDRIKALEKKAKELYESAYVFKSNNPDKAARHCRTVLKMVRKDAYSYERCKKLLEKLSGPGESSGGEEDF